MARYEIQGRKISQLPKKEQLDWTEAFIIEDAKGTKQASAASLKNYIGSGGGTVDQELNSESTNAVANKAVTEELSKLTTEYNVSVFYPDGGTDGTDKYTLETAIVKVPESLRNVGLKCSFLDEGGKPQTWEFTGGSWAGASFSQVGSAKMSELKDKITELEENGGGTADVDQALDAESTNAVANKAVTEKLSELGHEIGEDKIISWKKDYYINSSNGMEMLGKSFNCTDYIACIEGSLIITTVGVDLSYMAAIAFYDQEKTFISSVTSDSARIVKEVKVPSNTSYIRASCYSGYMNDFRIIIKGIGSYLLKWAEGKFPVTPEQTTFAEIELTDYILLFSIIEGFFYNSGRLQVDSSNTQNVTSIVRLDRTQDMFFSNGVNVQAVFFDANKNYISTLTGYSVSPIKKENYPENAVYVAFSYQHSNYLNTDKFHVSTRNNELCKYWYSDILKIKSRRPRIDIYLTDSEETIFRKLCNAWYTRDCDVYWECGTYVFSDIFELLKSKYGWSTAYELPLGGNCRYYFQGSTIVSRCSSSDSQLRTNQSLFGTHRLADNTNFELNDGTLIGEDCVYVVHDEGSGLPSPYIHKYRNLTLKYIKGGSVISGIQKCIGGGMGQKCLIDIDRCVFLNDHDGADASWHDNTSNDEPSEFSIRITNCYFTHYFSVGGEWKDTNKFSLVYSGNSATQNPANDKFDIKKWNNEIRE